MRRLVLMLMGGVTGGVLLPVLFTLGHVVYILTFEPDRGRGPAHHDPFWDFGPFIMRTAVASVVGLCVGLMVGSWLGRQS